MNFRTRQSKVLFGGGAIVVILVGAFALRSYGQFGYSRYTSPPANVAATVAGKKITVDYYAPSMHGRKIMGGLVPFGEVWCTGANWATKITTEAPLQMGSLKLPAGSYSIWTIPNAGEWTLIINKQTGQWGTSYDEKQDLGRVPMTASPVKATVETFVIGVVPGKSGKLTFTWENVEASVPVSAK
jgi:hypothetical protein